MGGDVWLKLVRYAYFPFRDKPTSVWTNPSYILSRDERLTRRALTLAS